MRDDGNASVEFVTVALVLTIPLVYVLLAVFAVQRAAFAVSAAAREAGRAYVTAAGDPAERAQAAADLALADQLPGSPHAALALDGALDPGGSVRVTVTYDVSFAGGLAHVPVTATHVATVDRYRSR
jgi:Flp pilus assembly protein TadG